MEIMKLTSENFEEEVLESDIPVLVDFWAEWCGPCKMMSAVVDDVAKDIPETAAKIGKINVDEEPDLAQRFNIMSIPTLILFKNGEIAETSVGVKPKQFIVDLIEE